MRLSKEDKYEFARAAIKARDLESLRDYIVSVVDAFDDLPPGKADVACPRYVGRRPGRGRAPMRRTRRGGRAASKYYSLACNGFPGSGEPLPIRDKKVR